LRIAILNYLWDPELTSPEALLDRYFTLTEWSEAVRLAGASRVCVYQRFSRDAVVERHGIRYELCADGGPPAPSLWTGGAGSLHRAAAAGAPDIAHVNSVLHPRRIRSLRSRLAPATALVVQDHGGFSPSSASTLKRAWIRHGLTGADSLLVAAPGQIPDWHTSGILPRALPVADVMECSSTMAQMDRDEARRRSGVEGTPALLWVGRLNRNKDPLTVLRGVAAFFDRCPDARLTLVYAEADLEPDVRDAIARTPALAARVRLAGRIPRAEMPAYFSAADLFVLGSHREGSGYALLDALACGAWPVVTDIPSFRALTGGGAAGTLWQPGDAASLADALARAERIASEDARPACRAHFEQHFSWPAIGRRALEIYDAALARRRRDRPPER
jgi:glycosyltransferase involved in cell wall biosynthesis